MKLNIKKSIHIGKKRLFINLGWFAGDDPSLFAIEILRKLGTGYYMIIKLQIAKFVLAIGIDFDLP